MSDVDDAIRNNAEHFMERGPALSYAYQTYVLARRPATNEVLLGGLGCMGMGEYPFTGGNPPMQDNIGPQGQPPSGPRQGVDQTPETPAKVSDVSGGQWRAGRPLETGRQGRRPDHADALRKAGGIKLKERSGVVTDDMEHKLTDSEGGAIYRAGELFDSGCIADHERRD